MNETPVAQATGVLCASDLEELDRAAGAFDPAVLLWVGVGSSWKRLREPGSEGQSAPALATLNQILGTRTTNVRQCVHFSPSKPEVVVSEIEELMGRVRHLDAAHALQLNGAVSAKSVEGIRALLPHAVLVTQLPIYRMSEDVTGDRVEEAGPIDDNHWVLVDGSGGQGNKLSRARVCAWRDLLCRRGWKTVGIAGGLGCDDVPAIADWPDGTRALLDSSSGVKVDGRFSVAGALRWFEAVRKSALNK